MSLSPRHEHAGRPLPPHPFRDSALLHGALALGIVVVSALTGGASAKIVLISVAYFVGATGWSWWRFRERIQAAARADPSTDEQR